MSQAADRVGLPVKPFLYTIDQIAMLISVDERKVRNTLLHYQGKSVGAVPKDKMLARDISPDDAEKPDWRVSEKDFVRWLRFKGFRYHERGYIK